uniref:No apical meristem-associated C-terminal domain-containing protein n=1 Tax=Oryza brachyantha TaxID=4533 RepID=J3N2E8_ORYBR
MGGGQPARRGSRPTKSASSLPQSGATQQGVEQVRLSAAAVTMAAGQGRPPTPPSSMVSGLRMSSPVPVHATPSLSPSLQAGFRPPVHRVGLAPPRPGASTLCGDVQETGSRADEVTNIADAMSGAAATDKLYLGWNVGEQQYMRQEDMVGMGYYMNLVNEDINYYDLGGIGSQPEDEQPSAVDCTTSVKPKQKRLKNFSNEKDELLVLAWLNVSLDPVSGSDQPKSTYWNRIYDYYHSNKTFISERNENSLMHRWSTIQEAVNKYCGYLSKIQERNESGVRLDDQEMQARIWYKKGDEHQRTFNFMNCYRLLKNQQKWMVWMAKRAQLVEQQKNPNKRQKSTTNAAPVMSTDVHAAAIGDVAANGQERPPGRKKEKEKLAKRSDQSRLDALTLILAEEKESDADKKKERSERYARAFSLQEQKIAIQKEEFELRKMLEEERIVRMDTSEMPADQQEFYKILKQQIIARRTINLDSS